MFGTDKLLHKDRDDAQKKSEAEYQPIKIIEQEIVYRDFYNSIFAIFSPSNGIRDPEKIVVMEAYKLGKYTPEIIKRLEFESKKDWKFQIEPVIIAWISEPARQAAQKEAR